MTSALPLPVEDAALATRLGVSGEAIALVRTSDVIDLHVDTFIPPRLWGYDPLVHHGRGPLAGLAFGHLDVPRMREGGLTAAMWSITTNPFRRPAARWRVFQRNLERYRGLVQRSAGALAIARTWSEHQEARAAGAHVVLPAIQGGNALEAAPEGVGSLPDRIITRVTVVHLTSSAFGTTSSPAAVLPGLRSPGPGQGLTAKGRAFVEQLDAHRVFVDLAHIHPAGFWDAVDVHRRDLPLIATHTGVTGVAPHWRNLDDRQIRAVADSGGVVGVIFAAIFLRRRGGPSNLDMVLEHLEHLIRVGGEDVAALGSDYDGAIVPPPDLRDGLAWPRLVQRMLERGWPEARIRKVLGANFLRSFRELRP